MDELNIRSIFPNNNIPKINISYKNLSFEEKLKNEVASLIKFANFSKVAHKVKVKEDPAAALLEKLRELSGDNKND